VSTPHIGAKVGVTAIGADERLLAPAITGRLHGKVVFRLHQVIDRVHPIRPRRLEVVMVVHRARRAQHDDVGLSAERLNQRSDHVAVVRVYRGKQSLK
jgi:hypothetical protein